MNTVRTFRTRTIYVSPDEIHGALARLGPTGDRDEAIVSAFARTLAEMLEQGGAFLITPMSGANRIERIQE